MKALWGSFLEYPCCRELSVQMDMMETSSDHGGQSWRSWQSSLVRLSQVFCFAIQWPLGIHSHFRLLLSDHDCKIHRYHRRKDRPSTEHFAIFCDLSSTLLRYRATTGNMRSILITPSALRFPHTRNAVRRRARNMPTLPGRFGKHLLRMRPLPPAQLAGTGSKVWLE